MIQPSPARNSPRTSSLARIGKARFPAFVLGRWQDLLALSLLLALAMGLLIRQIVLGGSFYDEDILLMSTPVYSWYSEQLKQGVLPLWSPALMGGAPLAFVIYDFFYPPDLLLFRLLDAARAFNLSLGLHLALAGGCTYWYCRVLGMRRLPSLLAAVGLQMGNEVLSWQSNGFITKALFALPALLAAIELMMRRSLRFWLLLPPIVGGALLVGHAQAVLTALATAAAYVLVAAIARRTALGTRRILYLLSLAGLGVALGLGLAAVRVAPTLAVAALSTRAGGMDFARSAIDSIEPWALAAGHLLPAVFELPGRSAPRPDFVGLPVLLLALLALFSFRGLDRVGRFHAGLAVVATVLSLGDATPAYSLLLKLPFFSLFREPGRLSVAAALGIAVLAAYALDRRLTLELPLQRKRRLALAATAVAVVAVGAAALVASLSFQFGRDPISAAPRDAAEIGGWGLLNLFRPRVALPMLGLVAGPLLLLACAHGRISHRTLEWSALAISSVTLFGLGWIQQPWLPPENLYEPPALLKTLESDPDRFRIFSWAPRMSTYNVGAYYRGVVGYPPTREFEERYLRQFLPPNLSMMFGVDSAEWYDALQTRRQALLSNYMGSDRAEVGRYEDGSLVDWSLHGLGLQSRLNLLAALNVKYVMNAFPIDDPRLELVDQTAMRIYPQFEAVARVYLYRLKTAVPRAFVVPQGEVMGKEKDVLESLMAGTVDLQQKVILEEPPPALEGPRLTPAGSRVEIADYRDEQVSLVARTDGSGFLVLADFLMPGWTATVDGRPEPILAGNFAGRAVPFRGAGEHRVQFRYDPPLLRPGLLASLASLAALLAIPLVLGLRPIFTTKTRTHQDTKNP